MPAMVRAVQTFGDLINQHVHIQVVVPEGVFTESGYYVYIPYVYRLRATELWQEKVFGPLVANGRINGEVVAMFKSFRHTGFNVDNSVRIEAEDEAGILPYFLMFFMWSRCLFSLIRMEYLTDDGKILCRALKPGFDVSESLKRNIPFSKQGNPELNTGIPRKYEIIDLLDFLTAVTQYILNATQKL